MRVPSHSPPSCVHGHRAWRDEATASGPAGVGSVSAVRFSPMAATRSTRDAGDGSGRVARARGVGDPLVGRLIDGRYLLLERLGAGGMGVVYKAQHRYTGEIVALKMLPGDPGDVATEREIRARFMNEPRLQLLARHPNIVRVMDAGAAGA